MPHVGFGIPTPAPDARPDTPIVFGRRAEEVGAHSVWGIDRLVFDNNEALMSLAAVASITTRVKLGTSVLLGTLRSPLLLAKMVATLDNLSNGRAILGLGVGTRPDDFEAAGTPFEQRGPRLGEHVEVVRKAWSGEPIQHEGRFYQYNVGPVGPRPVQRPGPPIWFGGSSDPALRRIGRLGDGYIASSSGGTEGFKATWAKLRRNIEEAGRDPSTVTRAALVWACVDEDQERATALASRYMMNYYGPKRATIGPEHLVGPADDCVRKAMDYFDAGLELLIVGSVTADPAYLDRFCEMVLPRLPVTGVGGK